MKDGPPAPLWPMDPDSLGRKNLILFEYLNTSFLATRVSLKHTSPPRKTFAGRQTPIGHCRGQLPADPECSEPAHN